MQTKRKFKKLPLHLSWLREKGDLLRVFALSFGKRRVAGLLFFKRSGKNP